MDTRCLARSIPSAALLLAGILVLTSSPARAESPPTTSPSRAPAAAPSGDTSPKPDRAATTASPQPWRPELELASLLDEWNLPGLVEENSAWKWLSLLAAVLVGLASGKVIAAILARLSRRCDAKGWHALRQTTLDLIGPASLALVTAGLSVGLVDVQMSTPLRNLTAGVIRLLYSIAASWYVFNLAGLVDLVFRSSARRDSLLDRQLVPMVRKTLRTIVVVLATLFIARTVFGQDVGTWLAGLGLAGLAVSLAAQDSLKNFFGSITILLDRPFQVGDRIVFGGYDGRIEEIGFRSTKIRTTAGHLVTIPNSKIVSDPVENVSRRPYIRRSLDLVLAQGTPFEKVQGAVWTLRDLLAEPEIRDPIHPLVPGDGQSPQVFLSELTDDKPRISITYCYAPPNPQAYADHAEKLNLRIYQSLAEAGIAFTVPGPAAPAAPNATPEAKGEASDRKEEEG